MSDIGHNSDAVAADRLRALIERIERLTDEKRALADDIREVFTEAKSAGFDPKVMREMLKERAMNADDLREREKLRDLYRAALGVLADTPLGQAATERAS